MTLSPDDLPACAGCGKCCHLLVELSPLTDDVPAEMIVERDGVRCMEQHGDGACVALDPATQLCTIYARRPQVCRDFQRGGSLCRRAVLGRRGSLAPIAPPRFLS
jgi:Fe-S-cluster containining protein